MKFLTIFSTILILILQGCSYTSIEMRSQASLLPYSNVKPHKVNTSSNWGRILTVGNINIRPFIANGIRLKGTSEIGLITIGSTDIKTPQLSKPFEIQIGFQATGNDVKFKPLDVELFINQSELTIKPHKVYLINKGKSCVFNELEDDGKEFFGGDFFLTDASKIDEHKLKWTCFTYLFDIATLNPNQIFQLKLRDVKDGEISQNVIIFFRLGYSKKE